MPALERSHASLKFLLPGLQRHHVRSHLVLPGKVALLVLAPKGRFPESYNTLPIMFSISARKPQQADDA
jgi:hypothetical protein